MTRTFIQTIEFSKNWDRLGFDDDDLLRLETDILKNPEKYPVVEGTGGLRKMRFAYEHQGKSGSTRVCYVDFCYDKVVYLITVYPKSEQDNLTPSEKNAIKRLIKVLKDNLY